MTSLKRFTATALLIALVCTGATAAPENATEINNSSLNSELFYQLLVGEISAQNGDTASAYSLMLDAARKANSPLLYQRAVELALSARSGESALSAAQAWAKALPTSADAHRYVLQILIGLNKIPETAEPIQKGLAALPAKERALAISVLPRYFARTSNKMLAANVVEQALTPELKNTTTGPAAWAAMGSMRLMAGDVNGALESARRGTAMNAKSDDLAALSIALMDAKSPNAEDMVLAYLAGKPLPELRMAYTRRLLDAQRLADAYKQTQLLTTQNPSFADGWLVKGSLELQDKKASAAEASLKQYVTLMTNTAADAQASETDRGLVQAYLLLAQLAEEGQRPDEAQAYLKRIDSTQDAIKVQSRRAAILARQGKMDEARALLRNTAEAQPGDARAKVNAEAQLLRDFKLFPAAYQLLEEAVKRFPGDTDLVYDLAMVAEKVGKAEEMEKLLRQVIAAKPDYHHAYNALGYSLADRNKNLGEARQLVTKALEFAPNDPYIIDSLGWVEFRSGNLPEALRVLRGAYQARPDAEIAAHLGEVLWAMGRRDEAQSIWKDGLQLNADNETLQETMQRLSKP